MEDNFWVGLAKSLFQLIFNKETEKNGKMDPVEVSVETEIGKPEVAVKANSPTPPGDAVDWINESQKVSKYFTVKDLVYLPTWKRLANASDGLDLDIQTNLIKLAQKMDTVREYFGKPVITHVSYRPTEYNKAIGGALHSQHSLGAAMDFHIEGLTCDEVREELVNKGLLETWGMRCEKAPGTNWVHLDFKELAPGGNRYFIP